MSEFKLADQKDVESRAGIVALEKNDIEIIRQSSLDALLNCVEVCCPQVLLFMHSSTSGKVLE